MIFLRSLKTGLVWGLVLWLFNGCSPQPSGQVLQRQLYVFGTTVNVSAWVRDGQQEAQFSTAIHEVEQVFQRMHRDWHAWEPGLLLSLNKALARGDAYKVPQDLEQLIRRSTVLAEASDNLFNPAIGGLIQAWGFHTSAFPVTGPPPSREALNAWVSRSPRMSDLVLRDGWVTSHNPAVQLDFGGVAKGVAVDRAVEILARHGLNNVIVNAGGDLRATGSKGGEAWRVGVRHPSSQYGGPRKVAVLAAVSVQGDEAVFTSGNYERVHVFEGKRWPHIIDPRDGQPVQHVASVTVIHGDALTADAAATALVVAGPKDWREVARNMGVDIVMLVDDKGQVFVTPLALKRFELPDGIEAVVVP